jgi:hypothetical protein
MGFNSTFKGLMLSAIAQQKNHTSFEHLRNVLHVLVFFGGGGGGGAKHILKDMI